MSAYCGYCLKDKRGPLSYIEIGGVPYLACGWCRDEEMTRRDEEEANTFYASHVLDWNRDIERREREAYEREAEREAEQERRDNENLESLRAYRDVWGFHP